MRTKNPHLWLYNPPDYPEITFGDQTPMGIGHTPHSISFLPTGAKKIKTFLLRYQHKVMKVGETDGAFDPKVKIWETKDSKKPLEVFPSAFRDEFAVFGNDDDYYFLTKSGDLYHAAKPAAGKTRSMTALWKRDGTPLVAFVEDLDRGKSFFFAKSKDVKEEVYFEMAPTLRPRPFPRRDVRPVRADGSLRTILEYVQIVAPRKSGPHKR